LMSSLRRDDDLAQARRRESLWEGLAIL